MATSRSGTWAHVRRGRRRTTWARSARSSCRTTATTRPRHQGRVRQHRSSSPARRMKTERLGGVANARARPVRPGARRLHEARGARAHPHQRRSARRCRTSRTASSSRATRTSSACRSARIIHSYDEDAIGAVERQLRGGPQDRQGDRRQGGVVGARRHADHPPDGRHHHGHRRRQLGDQQLRPDPRDRRTSTSPAPASSRPSGASNPTYTIFALSLRGAEHLAANWSSVAG